MYIPGMEIICTEDALDALKDLKNTKPSTFVRVTIDYSRRSCNILFEDVFSKYEKGSFFSEPVRNVFLEFKHFRKKDLIGRVFDYEATIMGRRFIFR